MAHLFGCLDPERDLCSVTDDITVKTFVLHDESVNSYGFRMLTAGASLDEFRKNPVMFYNHDDCTMPIGRWDNIRIDNDRILADAHFDELDPQGKEIARKVEAGYINACSIGAWVLESNGDSSLYLEGQNEPTVTRWVVREASICNIPSNHNALALYDAGGKRVAEEDIPSILELTDRQNQTTEPYMNPELKKLLGLADSARDEDALKALREQLGQLASMRDELGKLQQEQREAAQKELADKRSRFDSMLASALREGSLANEQKETFAKLFDVAPDDVLSLLESMPRRKSVVSQLKDDTQSSPKVDLLEMSWNELDRAGRLQELRDAYPDAYLEKFNAKFHSNH